MGHLSNRQLAVEIGDIHGARLTGHRIHPARSVDRFFPVLLLFEDFQQELQPLLLVLRALELSEHLLGAVEQAGLQIVLRQLVQRSELLVRRQIGPIEQVLVHSDRPLHFATTPEQAPQCKMQLDGLRIDFHHLYEGFDRLVRLLVEKKIQALEIGKRERARLGQQLLDVHPRRQPAEREEQRKSKQPPEFKFHRLTRVLWRSRLRPQFLAQLQNLAALTVEVSQTGNHACQRTDAEKDQHYHGQRRLPLAAEIETHDHRIGVLQREPEKQQEQQDSQCPGDIAHQRPQEARGREPGEKKRHDPATMPPALWRRSNTPPPTGS